jgi:hypothetical protein
MTTIHDFRRMTFNPRYGAIGLISWSGFFLFEYLAPIIEFTGWIMVPLALLLGALNTAAILWLILIAFGMGLMSSLVALYLDETFGYFNSPTDTSRLVTMAFIENLGFRQLTVIWRIRAMIGGESVSGWGNMERRGVANLDAKS